MAGETTLTIVGNLTADPEIRNSRAGSRAAPQPPATDPFNQQQQSQEPDPWASRQPAPPSDGFDADPEF